MSKPTSLTAKKTDKTLRTLILTALILKVALFFYITNFHPSFIFMPDSNRYIETGVNLASTGSFATINEEGQLVHETLRTPGYPVIIGVILEHLKLTLKDVILIQVILTLFIGLLVHRITQLINPQLATISTFIILFDPSITIYSLQIATEIPFIFLLTFFVYLFINYLQTNRLSYLAYSAITLALSIFVRPAAYYLPIGLTLFMIILYAPKDIKKILVHQAIFLIIIYSILSLWSIRNYKHFGEFKFSTISELTVERHSLIGAYKREVKNQKDISPLKFYTKCITRAVKKFFVHRMVLTPPEISQFKAWIIWAVYIFSTFVLLGLALGLLSLKNNVYLQFMFFGILYFTLVCIVADFKVRGGDRFRIMASPFIAILSAGGWNWLWINTVSRLKRTN